MRPRIICHMASTIDGRTDGHAFAALVAEREYENMHVKLKGDAWLCGRTTMQQHFAQKKPFIPTSKKPAGPRPVFVARRARSYAISVDTLGKLRWVNGDLHGDHLICVVSEQAPEDFLTMLQKKRISYIVAGKSSVNLAQTAHQLRKHFGIRRLLLEGGGHINGAFLQAGLVDEVSILVVPGIDGRHEIPAVFDGISRSRKRAVSLKLNSLQRLPRDTLWLRYEVMRPEQTKASI